MRLLHRTVDSHGRFLADFLPKDQYGEIVLSLGFGIYLHLQNEEFWVEIQTEFRHANILDEHMADLAVRITNGSIHVKMDNLDRITIPKRLLTLANIKRQLVVVPVSDWYFRLVAPEHLDENSSRLDDLLHSLDQAENHTL